MINHISIAVSNPEKVARVIAEIWGGVTYPFPVAPDGWMVFADDGIGTAIEVAAAETVLVPGDGQPPMDSYEIFYDTSEYEAKFVKSDIAPSFVATHLNINTKLSSAEIKAIADREGWRYLLANRGEGAFQLIELWIENRFMLEVMTPEMTQLYVEIMQPETYREWVGVPAETELELAA